MPNKKFLIILILFSIVYLDHDTNSENVDTTLSEVDEELFMDDNLFEQLLTESKLFYADAIMADLQGDTLNALYHFDNLF